MRAGRGVCPRFRHHKCRSVNAAVQKANPLGAESEIPYSEWAAIIPLTLATGAFHFRFFRQIQTTTSPLLCIEFFA